MLFYLLLLLLTLLLGFQVLQAIADRQVLQEHQVIQVLKVSQENLEKMVAKAILGRMFLARWDLTAPLVMQVLMVLKVILVLKVQTENLVFPE